MNAVPESCREIGPAMERKWHRWWGVARGPARTGFAGTPFAPAPQEGQVSEPEWSVAEHPCQNGSFPLGAQHNPEPASDGKREALLERTLALQEETLGSEHLHVAITLTQLMFLYRRQGKEPAAAAAAARATMILAHHSRQSDSPCT
jgi:hypothetical protein